MLPMLSTSFGPRRAEPAPDMMSLSTADLVDLADRLDHVADVRLLEGDPAAADRLTLRAHGLRAAAAVALAETSTPVPAATGR